MNDADLIARVRDAAIDEVPALVQGLNPDELGRVAAQAAADVSRFSRFDKLTAAQDADYSRAVLVMDTVGRIEHGKRADQLQHLHTLVRSGGAHVESGFGGGLHDRDPIGDPRDTAVVFRGSDPWGAGQVQAFGRSRSAAAAEYRSRALSAVEHMPAATHRTRAVATDLIEQFDDEDGRLSQFVLALSEPTYLRAFAKMARDPYTAMLDDDERQSVARVQQYARAMSLTDSAGGYLVPFQLDPTLIITANGSVNGIRQLARQVIATGDVWNGVSSGAVSWSYDAEASEVSDDAPSFAQPSIPIYTARGFVPISYEAMQDAANITTEVSRLLAFGKDVLEASAFTLGSGVGQPTGIITSLVGSSSVVNTATTDTFALSDVYSLHSALPARYRASNSAGWMANMSTFNRIRQFDTNGGAGLWATLGDGTPDRLLNRPVVEAEDMDGAINATQENYILVFGDWSNYVIADRLGMQVQLVPHLFGANRRPTGQSGWLAHVRHGADSVNDAAFRALNAT